MTALYLIMAMIQVNLAMYYLERHEWVDAILPILLVPCFVIWFLNGIEVTP